MRLFYKHNIKYIYMNYIYATIYWILCIFIFVLYFMPHKLFNFLYEKVTNNITNMDDPNFTGGIEYIFNPLRHFKCLKS